MSSLGVWVKYLTRRDAWMIYAIYIIHLFKIVLCGVEWSKYFYNAIWVATTPYGSSFILCIIPLHPNKAVSNLKQFSGWETCVNFSFDFLAWISLNGATRNSRVHFMVGLWDYSLTYSCVLILEKQMWSWSLVLLLFDSS